jgi:hypothetical protein
LQPVWSAVLGYGDERFSALARKVRHSLQRMPASGIYGDEYGYRTLWDEYCHEIQLGPHTQLEWAWDSVIDPAILDIVEKMPVQERRLLSLAAYEREGEPDVDTDEFPGRVDTLCDAVVRKLKELASDRNMNRFWV